MDAGLAEGRFGDEVDDGPELDACHVVDGACDHEGGETVDVLDLDALGEGLRRCEPRDLAGEVEAERLAGLGVARLGRAMKLRDLAGEGGDLLGVLERD